MMPGEPFATMTDMNLEAGEVIGTLTSGKYMKLTSFVDILVTNQLWLHKVQSLTQVGQEDFGYTIYNVLEERMNYWIVQE